MFFPTEDLPLWRHLLAAQHPNTHVPVEPSSKLATKELRLERSGVHTITSLHLGLDYKHSTLFVTLPHMCLMHSYMAWLSTGGLASLRRNVRRQKGLKQLIWQLFLSLKRKCVQLFMLSLNWQWSQLQHGYFCIIHTMEIAESLQRYVVADGWSLQMVQKMSLLKRNEESVCWGET